ncbi:hypothetical protein GCM10020000_65660 [Streptomyces olivoverticillatus]
MPPPPDLALLITWRAVQGVGAALVIPTALAIVSQTFPPAERGRAVGAYIGAASVFYVIGPPAHGSPDRPDQLAGRLLDQRPHRLRRRAHLRHDRPP